MREIVNLFIRRKYERSFQYFAVKECSLDTLRQYEDRRHTVDKTYKQENETIEKDVI